MRVKIECPICRAKNELTLMNVVCRRCKEDLSLLYQTKAYSLKYRLYFLNLLGQPEKLAQKQRLMQAATYLVEPSKSKVKPKVAKEIALPYLENGRGQNGGEEEE